jgi:small subunit ribosomal protein S5
MDTSKRSPRRPEKKESEFDSQLVDLARVTRVAAGGRRFRFRAVVISGDKKGRVGVGIAKGSDVAQAIEKATRSAEKRLITIPVLGDTIPHAVEAKFGASRIILRPQVTGRGLVAGSSARIICEKAGIKNISAKFISKTHNKLNNAMVTMAALKKLKIQEEKEQKHAAPRIAANTQEDAS